MTAELTSRIPNPPVRRPSIALALGSGGARGLAHILVLEVFDELGLTPKVIAGTSIGALFGAAYAAGLPAKLIRAFAEETLGRRIDLARQLFAARSRPVQKFLRILPLRSALIDAEALLEAVYPSQVPRRFEDLKIPLKVVATDLGLREASVLSSGELRPAVAASIAIPVLFSPVVVDGRTLLDGGLVNPLPYDLIADEADFTVAIDVSGAAAEADIGPNPSATDVLISSIQILEKSLTREKLKTRAPDIYIDVNLDKFHALQFHKMRALLEAAEPVKAQLKRQLSRLIESETLETAQLEAAPPPAAIEKRKRRRLLGRRRHS